MAAAAAEAVTTEHPPSSEKDKLAVLRTMLEQLAVGEGQLNLVKMIVNKLSNAQKDELVYFMRGPTDSPIKAIDEDYYKKIIEEIKSERQKLVNSNK